MTNASLILIGYLVLLFGFVLSAGFYNERLLWILIADFLFLALLVFKSKLFSRVFFPFDTVLILTFVVNILLYVSLFGGIYMEGGWAQELMRYLLPAALFSAGLYLFDFGRRTEVVFRLTFLLLVVIGLVWRVMMLVSSPAPSIDTFDLLRQGPRNFLEGKNPYEESYTSMYAGIIPNYYSYSPFTLYLFAPADLVFGDPRVTYIVVDLIVVLLMFRLLSGQKMAKFLLPLMYFYHPSRSFIHEQAWMDPLIFLALVLLVYTGITKGMLARFSFVFLGLFLGMKHTMVILAPLFWFSKKAGAKITLGALVFIAVAFAPFVVWSPGAFWEDMVKFYIDYPARIDSLTVNSYLARNFNLSLPLPLAGVFGGGLMFLLIRRKAVLWWSFILGVAVFLLAFFLFNKLAFVNYYFLVSSLLLLSASLARVDK